MGELWCPVGLAVKWSVVNLLSNRREQKPDQIVVGGSKWGVRSQTPPGQGLNLIVWYPPCLVIIPGTWCLLHKLWTEERHFLLGAKMNAWGGDEFQLLHSLCLLKRAGCQHLQLLTCMLFVAVQGGLVCSLSQRKPDSLHGSVSFLFIPFFPFFNSWGYDICIFFSFNVISEAFLHH